MDKNKEKTNEFLSRLIHDQKEQMANAEMKVKPRYYRGMNEDLTKLDLTD